MEGLKKGDVVLIHQQPQHPLPEIKSFLYGKEGVIKLSLHGNRHFIVEVEGELYEFPKENLIHRKLKAKPVYAFTLYRENDQGLERLPIKPIIFESYPKDHEIAKFLYEYKADYAKVDGYWKGNVKWE
jgi:hypothetical protein